MALDGLVISAIQKELNELLINCRIDKIYQPEKTEFIFVMKTKNGNVRLLLSCNSDHPGVYLTKNSYDNPPVPSGLCMFFRKHLQGGRISKVTQFETERFLEIHVDSIDELGEKVSKKVVVELLGRYSNIILVETYNEENSLYDDFPCGKILDCAKRGSLDVNTERVVLPGQPYHYPPSGEKLPFTKVLDPEFVLEHSSPLFDASKNISNYFQGVSTGMASQIVRKANSTDTNPLLVMQAYVKELGRLNYTPTVWLTENKSPKDFHLFDFEQFSNLEKVSFETANEAVDFYYSSRTSSNKIDQERFALTRSISNLLKKTIIKKRKLQDDILVAENSSHLRVYGELIMANLHKIKTGDSIATLENYYDGTTVEIPLDIKVAPAKNGQIYFKKFAKSKKAVEEKGKQLKKTEDEVTYFESVLAFLEMTTTSEEIAAIRDELLEGEYLRKSHKKEPMGRKKKKKISYQSYLSSNDHKILVGRNNKENEEITFKVSSRKDIWFHTKDIPGSHVVLVLDGDIPTDDEIRETAALAAHFSKASTSDNVPVDYVDIKNIKKMGNGKPGMVVFTGNNTIYVTPKDPKGSLLC